MSYQCIRNTFTQEQYDRHAAFFCAIPTAWGRLPGPTMLGQLRRAGGLGALSIYPVLGQFTHANFAGQVRYAKEEIARLTGRDVRTVRRGARGLAGLGFLAEERGWYSRQPITQWSIQPHMAAQRRANRLEDYFHFSSRLLYGGTWAKLSAVQQALLLAVATHSFSRYETPEENFWLQDAIRPGTSLIDLERCYEFNRGRIGTGPRPGQPFVRVAVLSYAQLAEILAISQSALKCAVKQLKHPALWSGSRNDPEMLQYSPLTVYPTDRGALLYHIRDHAPPWPWADLNQRAGRSRIGQ